MSKKIATGRGQREQVRERKHIPFRFIMAILFVALETVSVIAVVWLLTVFVPYFYFAVVGAQIAVAIGIVGSNDNPDYKLPWLFFVLLIPIIGFMLYFMFYSRKLTKKRVKRAKRLTGLRPNKEDGKELDAIEKQNSMAASQARALKKLADARVYGNTGIRYFGQGEQLFADMIEQLKGATRFIFLEYFIIAQGELWSKILTILESKAKEGVEVRIIYDDIGCMSTLPGNYYLKLREKGIKCVPFALLRGQATNEFNNRNHRKIAVIDGITGYTGGVNIADEYVNRVMRFGHWKDVGIRLQGDAVNELTWMFLNDYGMNDRNARDYFHDYYTSSDGQESGFCIPFGDGPRPIYERRVAKTAIQNMLGGAQRCVYITTPYLIIDNELTQTLENTALRGVDVRIILPHVPDKKVIFSMTRSGYDRLMRAGVSIYEYERGFVHAKSYIVDGEIAMVGTVNMDYRSLVHHFENGVWIFRHDVIKDMEADFLATQAQSIRIRRGMIKDTLPKRFVRSIVKIFAPLL